MAPSVKLSEIPRFANRGQASARRCVIGELGQLTQVTRVNGGDHRVAQRIGRTQSTRGCHNRPTQRRQVQLRIN
jgi:hypothetical protein